MLFLELSLTLVQFAHVCFGVKEDMFYTGELCDLEERMNQGCSKFVTDAKTANTCVFKCGLDSECIGASVDDHGKCFHHFMCNNISRCSRTDETHKYKSKKCAHGGVWNPQTSTCSCVRGWVGKNCLDLPSECQDLIQDGYEKQQTRVYLTLTPNVPLPVICMIAPPSWTGIRVLSNYGRVDFNRTWEEYRKGFFVNIQNFWIGLDSLHAVSSAGQNTLMIIISVGVFRQYSRFRVAGESQHFSFTFSSSVYQSNRESEMEQMAFRDCLGPLQGKPFSTKDKQDADTNAGTENCALKMGTGWWHDPDHCTTAACNFLGKTPEHWPSIPDYQRMKVDGMDPSQIENHESTVGITWYLK